MAQVISRATNDGSHTAATLGSTTTLTHLRNQISELRLGHLCSYAALTLGCLAGCQTAREVVDSSTPAMQSPKEVMSRTGNRVGESFETALEPLSRPNSSGANSIQQVPEEAMATKVSTYPKSLARHPSQIILPPQPQSSTPRPPTTAAVANNGRATNVEYLAPPPAPAAHQPLSTPKTVQPVAGNAPANRIESRPDNRSMKSARPESAPAPIAPPEPLPANEVTQSRAITPISATANQPNSNVTTAAATNVSKSNSVNSAAPKSNVTTQPSNNNNAAYPYTTWCRVRVRNIGTQAAKQVALSVSAPPNAQLLAADGRVIPSQKNGNMEFTAIPQVGPNEEVVVTVGVAASDNTSNRLRVQVRDALGGTNQEVQQRWKVTLEASEPPQ